LEEFVKKFVMLFSFGGVFETEAFVGLLLVFLLLHDFFDLWVLVSLKLGDESFLICLFFG